MTGRGLVPSLSHMIIGGGFPLNSQVNMTSACSRTMADMGLDSTALTTEKKKKDNLRYFAMATLFSSLGKQEVEIRATALMTTTEKKFYSTNIAVVIIFYCFIPSA